ncbi:nitroreductase family deazaflavin-dependent oxidoreductase [Actinomadura algeriensis]|uniref:Deazaflavin-dependent oxidoreductase (Nitroreductase family) n=1 Tax=Actinomadura algeriensis TaxID=1679523 RepID=A0ABR9K547_9ACTN|nr:nitroreductase family deazaflavin-dependent oxidoreductase [Actinomadura algeriensis]MBE1537927.1 deazaflavin-dependent oxidoreductase (nitroreductase family) [Actinomadura algeriensis]
MEIVKTPAPPSGVRRLLWRLPIHFYRRGLGVLMPPRIMLLTHIGRKSGRPRQAVIEVIERGPDGYVAASGFGVRADWYQNVLKTPDVTIQVGRRVIPVTAEVLAKEDGAELMALYGPRNPRTAKRLCSIMGFAIDGSVEDFRAVGERVPFVRFVPRAGGAG